MMMMRDGEGQAETLMMMSVKRKIVGVVGTWRWVSVVMAGRRIEGGWGSKW